MSPSICWAISFHAREVFGEIAAGEELHRDAAAIAKRAPELGPELGKDGADNLHVVLAPQEVGEQVGATEGIVSHVPRNDADLRPPFILGQIPGRHFLHAAVVELPVPAYQLPERIRVCVLHPRRVTNFHRMATFRCGSMIASPTQG